MADDEDRDDEVEDYDSGPYCQHWGDPSDCNEICAKCGHECWEHRYGDDCEHEGCECEGFVNKDEQ